MHLLVLVLLTACFDSKPDTAHPCEGVELPPCPDACPDDYAATCGEPCEVEGEVCGNEIGDGRECSSGTYTCSVHAPLGEGCNLVCDPGLAR